MRPSSRPRASTQRPIAAVLIALLLITGIGGPVAAVDPDPSAGPTSFVRVDQVGYTLEQPRTAWLLAPRAIRRAPFRVEDRAGVVVLRGTAGRTKGRWNGRFRSVQPLDLRGLTTAGEYRIVMEAGDAVPSPWFQVGAAYQLVDPLIVDSVTFFQGQRDGADVIPGDLGRGPAHLHDATAPVMAWPTFTGRDSDVITADLVPLGATTDLTGGWSDAGDTLKLTHAIAYADALLWASARELGGASPEGLVEEARHGLDWLERAWHPDTGVLDLQVGIGGGAADGSFLGDHDVWRRPETDDALDAQAGPALRFLAQRPAFRANEPGEPVPPNLAGRVAAAFGVAAQVLAPSDATEARRLLDLGAGILAAARTTQVARRHVVTALPRAYYPEDSWRDDLAWGSVELARAGQALDDPRADAWLADAIRWMDAYLRRDAGNDTLNVYDTSALALADLVEALRTTPSPDDDADTVRFVRGLRDQLRAARRVARRDPFGAAVPLHEFDAAPHAMGITATGLLYRRLTGDRRFDRLVTTQRGWVLGANPWGISFLVGAGRDFVACPHHMIANLATSADGAPVVLRGALVNGPNAASLFADGIEEPFDEAVPCPADGRDDLARFTGRKSRFVDSVSAWQTVEPAIDFSATALYALALTR